MSDTERIPEEKDVDTPVEESTDANDGDIEAVTEAQSAEDGEDSDPADEQEVDYAALAEEDMRYLITLFPHLAGKKSTAELDNPLRYAALRDLGLSPTEAYLATNFKPRPYDNRSHLRSAVPMRASAPSELLGRGELEAARELFAGLSDREIQRLYKKVSKTT